MIVRCFGNDYVGKKPVAWKGYFAEYWLKELQESMHMCTGRRDITEILLKTALNSLKSINQSMQGSFKPGNVWLNTISSFSHNVFKSLIFQAHLENKTLENIVGLCGKTALSLFVQCFRKLLSPRVNLDCVVRVKSFPTQPRILTSPRKEPFENFFEKGENADNRHFLLFPKCFPPFPKTTFNILFTFVVLSASAFNLDWSKIFIVWQKK